MSRILNIAVPTSKKQVRSLLGVAGFYRRYVPNYASVDAPLVELTKKHQPAKMKWSEACQEAFEKLTTALTAEPVVRLPDFKKALTTRPDASGADIEAVLMQCDDEGCLHSVSFASRKLLDRETRYSTVEKECLALV